MHSLKVSGCSTPAISTTILLLISLFFAIPAISATINVPADYPTIQAGINAAVNNDTVLVAPGLYYENVCFNGRTIVVTSHFAIDQNPEYIFSTIIDGSRPHHPDTASTVVFNLGTGAETVLQGFTIRGGHGTMHSWSAGQWDRMGGGVFMFNSLGTIKYNYITDNYVDWEPTVHAGGGGGIMLQYSYAWVENNIITHNHGNYGAGIAHGHGTSFVTNNVIAYNWGGEVYGSAGLQIYNGTITLQNNTIVGNKSVLPGGGFRIFGTVAATIRNNIVWYNEAPSSPQLCDVGAIYYCNVQGGWPTGSDNIDLEPRLSADDWLYLYGDSPNIDAGDTAVSVHDIAMASDPASARWPSYGGLRDDIGAYGGPGAFAFHTVGIYADTTLGWNALEVNFDVEAPYNCNGWTWNFGDGTTLPGKTVTHSYNTAGLYDVTVSLQCDEFTGDVVREGLIAVLADTLKADEVSGFAEETVEVTISTINHIPLERIVIPIEYSDDCHLYLQSWTTGGCRTEAFESSVLHLDTAASQRLTIVLEDDEDQLLPVGEGPVLKLEFVISSSCGSGSIVPIVLDGYDEYLPTFEGPIASYEVPTVAGEVTSGCCGLYTGGYTGNTDCDIEGKMNLTDVTRLIDRIYLSRSLLCCEDNGNVDGSTDGKMNLTDVTKLIDHIYLSKQPTTPCM